MSDSKDGTPIDGKKIAADLLAGLDAPSRDRILGEIRERDPELALELKRQLFTFEDLVRLDDASLQFLLADVPRGKLVLAMRRVSSELSARIFSVLPLRAGETLREEIATLGPKKLSDVELAQQDLAAWAYAHLEAGKIALKVPSKG